MRRILVLLAICLAIPATTAGQSPSIGRLEFMLTRDGLRSLWNAKAAITLSTPFDRARVAAALPGYEVRAGGRAPTEEPMETLEVSKDGVVMVRIYGSAAARKIHSIVATNRTVDEIGVAAGAPLKSAYSTVPKRCYAGYDAGCMSSYSDNVSYEFDDSTSCPYYVSPPSWPIPECVKITALLLWKP